MREGERASARERGKRVYLPCIVSITTDTQIQTTAGCRKTKTIVAMVTYDDYKQ